MTSLYIKLSAMMFLQFAVWGAWVPVLAARLLGPLKMSGKQTGWIYATLPLSCMISPLLAGQLADKYVDAGTILVVCHGLGCLLLFVAARVKPFSFGLLWHGRWSAICSRVGAISARQMVTEATASSSLPFYPSSWP